MSALLSDVSLPIGWVAYTVADCLSSFTYARKESVLRSDYRTNGTFPIIDQGQEFIAGYTDDEALVYGAPLPLIVFGDHTRTFKYVDFPFATGADGTKLLIPDQKLVDAKFFYYALKSLDLPSRGYNRHFTHLRNQQIPMPEDLNAQGRIVQFMDLIETSIEVEVKTSSNIGMLKAAAMTKLFCEGLRGEVTKQTDIGEVPVSWKVVPLGSVARISTGTTPSTDVAEYYQGAVPFVKTAEIDNNRITSARTLISDDAVRRYNLRLYSPGTVFLAMYGQGKTRGRVALLDIAAATTQNTGAIEPGDLVLGEFIWHYLLGRYEELRHTGNLGHLSHLNLGYVRDILVPLPEKDEQQEIVRLLRFLHDRSTVSAEKVATLRSLFGAALRDVLSGGLDICFSQSPEVRYA